MTIYGATKKPPSRGGGRAAEKDGLARTSGGDAESEQDKDAEDEVPGAGRKSDGRDAGAGAEREGGDEGARGRRLGHGERSERGGQRSDRDGQRSEE